MRKIESPPSALAAYSYNTHLGFRRGATKKGEEKGVLWLSCPPSAPLRKVRIEAAAGKLLPAPVSRPKKRHTLKWFVWVRNVGKTYLQICFHF